MSVRRLVLYVTTMLLMLQLGGCGIISLGYNYSDVYLRYTINSYANFDKAQKEQIHRDVDEYMRWHRRVMLPEYVAYLRELQHKVESGTSLGIEEVREYRMKVRKLYVSTLQPTVIPASKILYGMSASQAEEVQATFDRENGKQRDKELSGNPELQLKLRTERTVDFIENLVGALSDKQQAQLNEANSKLPFASEIYLRLREDNQRHLLDLVKQHAAEEGLAEFLSQWLIMPEKLRKPEEQEILLAFEQGSDQLLVEMYAMLTERQKNKLLKNISRYADSFERLSRE